MKITQRKTILSSEIFIGLHEVKRRQYIENRCNPLMISKAQLIKNVVCDKMGQSIEDIDSGCRKREFVNVRQIAMYFIAEKTTLTLKEIGEMFGGRDHSTVIYSKETVEGLMDVDKQFKTSIKTLEALLEIALNKNAQTIEN